MPKLSTNGLRQVSPTEKPEKNPVMVTSAAQAFAAGVKARKQRKSRNHCSYRDEAMTKAWQEGYDSI